MKKIFILTGEPSGDKLAAEAIIKLKKKTNNIQYLSLGGENLKKIGVETIFNLNEVTYLGFTKVLTNIFKIKKKINETANKIIEFDPDILFSVDSPDFTLRVAEIVKKRSKKIKTIHFVAPQVWVWRENRVKKIKKFIDHILLLFKFEKKYFEKENINCKFVGHPLLEKNNKSKIDINQIIEKNKAIISIFPGSRVSEIEILMPILLNFIKLMNEKYDDFLFVFHSTETIRPKVEKYLKQIAQNNCQVISDEKIKNHILEKSVFAIAKSGTISLEIANKKIPSIIIYKMNFINFMIVKALVKIRFANIINIAADKMIIPELLQSKCNSKEIFKSVTNLIENSAYMDDQVKATQEILNEFKTNSLPSELIADFLKSHI